MASSKMEKAIGRGETLLFQIRFDNEPELFKGTHWRSFIIRYGENEIGTGLFVSNDGVEFRLYGETRLVREKE